jgi:hypothetical protein
MNNTLLNAKSTLEKESLTCIITNGESVYKSNLRGIKPLLEFVQNGVDTRGFYAADKVVGKAAAYLYVLLGVKEIYAQVVSEAAEAVLSKHQIPLFYEEKVPAIRNRTNTGFCPMEQAVWEIDDPLSAKQAIVQKLDQLRGNTP